MAKHFIKEALAQPEQEPVTWGVDWGKAGDIPCVSIIKRLPDGGIKVMAVEYAPYSYTTPPKQEPIRIMGFDCVCGRRMTVSAEQGVVPAPQRTWVGLTDEDRKPLIQQAMTYYGHNREYWLQTSGAGFCLLVQAIETKLKQKNGYAEDKT